MTCPYAANNNDNNNTVLTYSVIDVLGNCERKIGGVVDGVNRGMLGLRPMASSGRPLAVNLIGASCA